MGCPFRKCLFFQDLEALTEVFGGMSAGMSGRKLPLWAEFSFLTFPKFQNCHLALSDFILSGAHLDGGNPALLGFGT